MSRRAAITDTTADLLSDLSSAPAPVEPGDPANTTDTADSADLPAGPQVSMLIPTFWQRFVYWAWHPVSRSSLAVLVVAGLLPLLLSLTQHLTSADNARPTQPVVTAPVVTVPVTISVPVTVTSTPPVPTSGAAPAPAPVTVVRTTVLTTVQPTGGKKPPTTTAPRPLVGPNVGAKGVICFTPATLQITVTGKGAVELNVDGAATAHRTGRGSAQATVSGGTGSYAITYVSTTGQATISTSVLQGACS